MNLPCAMALSPYIRRHDVKAPWGPGKRLLTLEIADGGTLMEWTGP